MTASGSAGRIRGATTRRFFIGGAAIVLLASKATARLPDNLELITQELADALAPGTREIWAHWTHPDFVLTDENGARIERKQFLSEMSPLPPGATGTIKVTDFVCQQAGDTRVATYILDELEHFHGEDLHACYRQTDTWVRTAKGWRLVASHIIALRTDPPAVELPAKLWEEYAGHYQLPDGLSLEIVWNGKSATIRKGSGIAHPLKAELSDLLFIPGDPRIRYVIQRGADGRIFRLLQRRESWDIVWKRADTPPRPVSALGRKRTLANDRGRPVALPFLGHAKLATGSCVVVTESERSTDS
jgi:hypothetical protein